ncbi:T9SS type A sorting domain-containing protein [Carboxylicivirga mesophila]|uniref:T9SS type A sorting domain-containing protein n=1 Tax=Carboxylicivirga mesophila TaxID=1166478 RepID=A0ABS5KCQ3_9BACT|nr:T9SS type A sorting domain-containing protein [Carboxylicivirga mesophila]MBS2212773.1 T9SS type A sorting domain-containing protein [Carboxylicivirga mesophila]
MKRNLTLFILLLFFYNIQAQAPQWISITASYEVVDIKEEGDLLWLATQGGVIKFHKETGEQELFTSTNSGLCDNRVQSIVIEESGKKWFGTANGVSSFDDTNWIVYRNELPDNFVNSVAIDQQGNKWFGTQSNGCAMYDDSQWKIYNNKSSGHPTTIVDIVIDNENAIWFATFGMGICKFHNNQWTQYNTSNSNLPYDYVTDLMVDTDNSIWFNVNTGVYKIEQNTVSMISSDIPDCLTIDPAGNKWFGFRNGGISKYNETGNSTYPYIPALGNREVRTIEVVSNGDFWIGTNDGIVLFDHTSSEYYSTATSGLPSALVYNIHIDKNGNKWFGTNQGAARFDGSDWLTFKDKDSDFYLTQVFKIISDLDGNIWMATNAGVARFADGQMKMLNHMNSPLPNTIFSDVDVDPISGDVWVTSAEGVLSYDGTNWLAYNATNSDLPSNNVSCVAIDATGIKWFGTQGSGIAKFDNTNWELFNGSNSPVDIDYINSISIDKDQKKWIYTSQRVIEYNEESWITHWHLDYQWRGKMHEGIESNKWFTGYSGLTKFTGAYYEHFTMENSGLPANWCYSFVVDDKLNKWIATIGGVGVYNENGVDISPTPTSVNISPVSTNLKFKVSPNPASSHINIKFNPVSEQEKINTIEVFIYDASGRLNKQVSKAFTSQTTINVGDISSGIYFVKIKYGEQIGQTKFVKL